MPYASVSFTVITRGLKDEGAHDDGQVAVIMEDPNQFGVFTDIDPNKTTRFVEHATVNVAPQNMVMFKTFAVYTAMNAIWKALLKRIEDTTKSRTQTNEHKNQLALMLNSVLNALATEEDGPSGVALISRQPSPFAYKQSRFRAKFDPNGERRQVYRATPPFEQQVVQVFCDSKLVRLDVRLFTGASTLVCVGPDAPTGVAYDHMLRDGVLRPLATSRPSSTAIPAAPLSQVWHRGAGEWTPGQLAEWTSRFWDVQAKFPVETVVWVLNTSESVDVSRDNAAGMGILRNFDDTARAQETMVAVEGPEFTSALDEFITKLGLRMHAYGSIQDSHNNLKFRIMMVYAAMMAISKELEWNRGFDVRQKEAFYAEKLLEHCGEGDIRVTIFAQDMSVVSWGPWTFARVNVHQQAQWPILFNVTEIEETPYYYNGSEVPGRFYYHRRLHTTHAAQMSQYFVNTLGADEEIRMRLRIPAEEVLHAYTAKRAASGGAVLVHEIPGVLRVYCDDHTGMHHAWFLRPGKWCPAEIKDRWTEAMLADTLDDVPY